MKRINSLLLTLFILVSWSSHASGAGTYVGFSFGQSDVGIDYSIGANTIVDEGSTFKIFGGQVVNGNLSVEGGYVKLGDVVFDSTTSGIKESYDNSAIYVDLIASLPLTAILSVYGKVGISYWNSEVTLSGGATGTGKDNGISPLFGLGGGVNVLNNLSFRVEWERYNDISKDVIVNVPGTITLDGGPVDNLNVSLLYTFPM